MKPDWQDADLERRREGLSELSDDVARYGPEVIEGWPWRRRPGSDLPSWARRPSEGEWRKALPTLFSQLPAELAAQVAFWSAPATLGAGERIAAIREAAEAP